MSATRVPTQPATGAAWFSLCITVALFATTLAWAFRGHRMDWFWWTLLLMVAAGTVARLNVPTRWRLFLRALSLTSAAATGIGLLYAIIRDRLI